MRCLAAKIICAFRSLKLASRFSGVSSQTALPPISLSVCGSGSADEVEEAVVEGGAMRDCSLYRDISDSLALELVAVAFVVVLEPVEAGLGAEGVLG